MAAQKVILSAKGLKTNNNSYSEVEDGALRDATNISIDRAGIISPRRGWARSATALATGGISSVGDYAGTLVSNQGFGSQTGLFSKFNTGTGTWTTLSGSYFYPDSTTKMRYVTAGGSLFFTTSTGVYKLDGQTSTAIVPAGLPKGVGIQATAFNSGTGSWLANNTSVAYRYRFTFTDAQGRLIRGSPSGRKVLSNITGGVRYPTLVVGLPVGTTTSWVMELYRSNSQPFNGSTAIDPSDEMYLAYSIKPSATDLSNGFITVNDIVPDSRLGTALETNNNQNSILQAPDQPPLTRDLALYKNCLFYANTTGKHILSIKLLAVGGIALGDRVSIDGVTYVAGSTENVSTNTFRVETGLSDGQNIRNTAESLVYVVNRSALNTRIYAFYDSTSDQFPGYVHFEERGVGGVAYSIGTTANTTSWFPTFPQSVVSTALNMSRTAQTISVTTSTAHGFTIGQNIMVSAAVNEARFTRGYVTVLTTPTTTSFTYLDSNAGTNGTNSGQHEFTALTVNSKSDRYANGLYFSRQNEFEAVPALNFVAVGDNGAIQRIIPLRNALIIIKEDGVYRLTGEDPTSFTVSPVDLNVRCLAPETVVALNNQVYLYSEQGVLMIGDIGVAVISFDIEDKINIVRTNTSAANIKALSFGVAYESDRKYMLFLPAGANYPNTALVYNYVTNAWTTSTRDSFWSCGIVLSSDTKLYLPEALTDTMLIERKTRTNMDFADDSNGVNITSVGTNSVVVNTLPFNIGVGDVLWQSAPFDTPNYRSARISAIDVGTNTLTLQYRVGTAFQVAGATIYQGINSSWTYTPIFGESPTTLKRWYQTEMKFTSPKFTQFNLSYQNDYTVTPVSDVVFGNSQDEIRVTRTNLIPRQAVRSTEVAFSMQSISALESWYVQGIALSYFGSSLKAGRTHEAK